MYVCSVEAIEPDVLLLADSPFRLPVSSLVKALGHFTGFC